MERLKKKKKKRWCTAWKGKPWNKGLECVSARCSTLVFLASVARARADPAVFLKLSPVLTYFSTLLRLSPLASQDFTSVFLTAPPSASVSFPHPSSY